MPRVEAWLRAPTCVSRVGALRMPCFGVRVAAPAAGLLSPLPALHMHRHCARRCHIQICTGTSGLVVRPNRPWHVRECERRPDLQSAQPQLRPHVAGRAHAHAGAHARTRARTPRTRTLHTHITTKSRHSHIYSRSRARRTGERVRRPSAARQVWDEDSGHCLRTIHGPDAWIYDTKARARVRACVRVYAVPCLRAVTSPPARRCGGIASQCEDGWLLYGGPRKNPGGNRKDGATPCTPA
jgi:hypothetical protein